MILYLRASQDRWGNSISVDSQYDEGHEFCTEAGATIVAVYSDNDLSGSTYATEARGGYEQALSDLIAGRGKMLWTFDHSRAQRDIEVYGRLRRICMETGALWAYGGRVYDMSDPVDRAATLRDAVEAEGAALNISIHSTRGIRARAKRGDHPGPKAYGYKPYYCQETGKSLGWYVVEEEKRVIRMIVDWLLGEKPRTLNWIARELNRLGIPTPRDRQWDRRKVSNLVDTSKHEKEWDAFLASLTPEDREWAYTVVERVTVGATPKDVAKYYNVNKVPYFHPSKWCGTKVKNIALSPPSAGLRRYKKQIMMRQEPDPNAPEGFRLVPIDTNWDEIKTYEEHLKLKALLEDKDRRASEPHPERVKHLWTGIATCGECGDKICSVFDKGMLRYRCAVKSCVLRRQDLTDAWLTEQALLLLEREDAAQIFRMHDEKGEAGKAQDDLDALRAQLADFRRQAVQKKISAESFAYFEAELLPEIEKAEERLRRALLPAVLETVVGKVDVRAAFLSLDVVQQRKILRAIMAPKIYKTKKKVRGKLDTTTIDPGFRYVVPPTMPGDEHQESGADLVGAA
ncbi:hypothetical protein Lesp01_49430 [Lentzea sp. NBRC 102530]|nr:hypothetical protein Lesp01_49430 [Lentzea sp. NBRC 102530]